MLSTRRLADQLMIGAERLMPVDRREWSRAMRSEQVHIREEREALAFSAGCLRAAVWERLRSLAPDSAWFWPGLAVGILLLLSASIPGSRSWPLLWPPIAGVLLVLALDRKELEFGRAVGLALNAGLLGGLLFFIGVIAFYDRPDATLADRMWFAGIAGAVMAALTTIGGAAVAPLVTKPPRAGAFSKKEH